MLALAVLLPTTGLFSPKTAKAAAETPVKTCAAATQTLTAVSYGNRIFLFDNASGGVWLTYEHATPLEITHIEFANDTTLYFLDQKDLSFPTLYRLGVDDFLTNTQAVDTGVRCNSFSIFNGELYSTIINPTETNFLRAPLEDLQAKTSAYSLQTNPHSFAVTQGKAYALDGMNHLYELTADSTQELATLPAGANAIVLVGDVLYGLTNDGSLFCCDAVGGNQTVIEANGGYASLSTDGERLYMCKNGALYVYQAGESVPLRAPQNDYPTADQIPLGNAKTELAQASTATVERIQTQENALLLCVDLQASETNFQLLSVRRGAATGICLYQDANYTLFVCYEEGYKTYLTANDNVRAQTTGYTPLTQTGYANGQGSLYKYPLLSADFPALVAIERNQALEIVGELEGIDGKYYAVKIGEDVGYLPATHARTFEGSAPPASQLTLGEQESEKDAVWRLAYLLLGGVALCILADVLLLRKKSGDE